MKSLLIGSGQEFSLVQRAFIRNKNKFKVIGENVSKHRIFKNKDRKEITLSNFLNKEVLKKEDLDKINSIFISIYEREKLSDALKIVEDSKFKKPVFIISTAITPQYTENFPAFHFLSIHDLFTSQIRNFIVQCEFLFKVESIKSLVKTTDNVLIMIFENPDPDAIASSVALKTLLSRMKVKSKIAYTGEITRLQNRVLMKELAVDFYHMEKLNIADFTKFAVVDAQPYFFRGKYSFDIVIDHHPRRERIKAAFIDVRPKIGSTSTILTQYLINAGIRINKKLATALLYAIKTDTNNLERHVLDEDIMAFRYLFNRTDKNLLKKIELSEIPCQALPYFEQALKNARIDKDEIYVNLGKTQIPEVNVMVADFLMRLEGILKVIVTAIYNDTIIITFRNAGHSWDAGQVATAAFNDIGHAGGHSFMARAEIPFEDFKKLSSNSSMESLDDFILSKIRKHTAPQ